MRRAVFIQFFLVLMPIFCFAKSGQDHVSDMLSVVFENANVRAPEVRSCLYEFTKTIDNFEIIKALPLGKDGHRLYGHWGYSDSIPFNKEPLKGMLERIELAQGKEAAEAAKDRIIKAWRSDVATMENLSAKMLRVQGRTAKGFAGLLYDIHLLGDYLGVKLDSLQNIEALKNDLAKNINRIFGNNSQISRNIIGNLDKAFKLGATPAEKSCQMLDFLSKSPEFRTCFQNLLQKERFVASSLRAPVALEMKAPRTADEVKKIFQSKLNPKVDVVPGLISNGKLFAAMGSGASAGIMVFMLDAAVPAWQYYHGNILKQEFREKITEAAINGAGVGGAAAVMVCLGANPAGIAVLGVSAGTYFVIDQMQQFYRENRKKSFLSREDLAAFGIPPDAVLEVKIDDRIPLNAANWN